MDVANSKITFSYPLSQSPILEQEPFETAPGPLSEPAYTFDIDENVAGMFMLDIRNLLFHDTFEGSLVHEVAPAAFENLVNHVDISQMEIIRDSVTDNQNFNPLYTLVDPDIIVYGDNDRVVAATNNTPGDLLKDSQRYIVNSAITINADMKKLPQNNPNVSYLDLANLSQDQLADATRTGTIHELENIDLNGVRVITFTDDYAKRLKSGEFAYTVKMTVTNKISDYLIQIFGNLKSSIEQNRITLLDSYKEENYDFQNNKFKNSYIDAMNQAYGFSGADITSASTNAPWVVGIYHYREVSALMSSTPVDILSLINSLAPSTTDQNSLQRVIRAMESLLENVLRRYNYNDSELYEGNFDSRAGTQGSINRKKTFTIEKTFKKTIQTDNADKMGYSFFDADGSGIQNINKKLFSQRATEEFNKFFNSAPSRGDLGLPSLTSAEQKDLRDVRNNMFSYLTPTEIRAGSERMKIDGSDRSFDLSFANRLELQKGSRGTKARKGLTRRSSLRSGFQFGAPKQFRRSSKDEKYVRSSDYLGGNSLFNISELQQLANIEEQSKFEEQQNINMLASIQVDKRRSSGKVPSLKGFKQMPRDRKKIKGLPLQLKSLILSNSKSTKSDFGDYDIFEDPNTRSAAGINFTKIRQVEYLKGFDIQSGLNMINSPTWALLDKEALDNLEGKKLVCRLQPYTNDYYDISDDPDDIKDYNGIFTIDGERI